MADWTGCNVNASLWMVYDILFFIFYFLNLKRPEYSPLEMYADSQHTSISNPQID